MPLELDIEKPSRLCAVKGCRNPRPPKRNKRGCVCSKCAMRDWREWNPVKAAFSNLRFHAAARRKPFAMSFEEFRSFALSTGYLALKGVHAWELHADRVDPARGYEPDNVQPLTCRENVVKEHRERRECANPF